VLVTIERYYDAVPRAAARVETIGPFTLFVKQGAGWPYYARPTLGATTFVVDDVDRVRARQRALEVPEAFEWVAQTTPGAAAAVAASGLTVHEHPLMMLDPFAPRSAPPALSGIEVRPVRDDDDLGRISDVGRLAFAAPGTAVGTVGTEALAATDASPAIDFQRERLRAGLTVTVAAFTPEGEPVAIGSHQPVEGVSEIVGVGTLPAFRRRGIAATITAMLIDDALRRVQTVFLSAGDADVARMYQRLGFRLIGTACTAEA
jgi:ribosomal protein S18 acetylase RimI-like enzyme